MDSPTPHRQKPVSDLIRILFVILLVGALLFGSFWVMRPFLGGILWGGLVVVASWPLMLRVQGWVGGSRGAATALMMVALILVVVVPLTLSIVTLVDHGGEVVDWISSLRDGSLAKAPAWVAGLPYVGPRAAAEWENLLGSGPNSLGTQINAHGREITSWVLAQVGSIGSIVAQFTIMICSASLLFLKGESAAAGLRRLARHIGGERANGLVLLAASSISAVALGIVVTAMVQAFVGGFGMLITGVPFVSVLTSLMLMMCLIQLGPAPVLIPAVLWLFYQGHTWQGAVLAVFAVVGMTLDNILRPLLIQRGGDMPLLLIFVGSMGGLIGFGLVGLFIGPVFLAMTWALVQAWMDEAPIPPSTPVPEVDQKSSDAAT